MKPQTSSPQLPQIQTLPHGREHFVFSANTAYADHIRHVIEVDDESFCEISIFVSCFNEQNHVSETLNTVVSALSSCGRSYEIIIIDDCSTDRSAEVVTDYIRAHPDLRIVLRVNFQNVGLGQNFTDAVFLARGKYFRHVCGDNVEPLETLLAIFNEVGQADLVLPYHVNIVGKSMIRQRLSKVYTKLINILSGNSVRYYNGLPLFKRHDLERTLPVTAGFGFQADIVTRLLARGASYHEIPVKMVETKASTALSMRNFLSVLHVVFEIVIRRLAKAYHRR